MSVGREKNSKNKKTGSLIPGTNAYFERYAKNESKKERYDRQRQEFEERASKQSDGIDSPIGNKWDLYYKGDRKMCSSVPDYMWNVAQIAVFARKITGPYELATLYGYMHGDLGDYLVIGFDGFITIEKKENFEKIYMITSASVLYSKGIRIPMSLLDDLDDYVNNVGALECEIAENLLYKLSDGHVGCKPGCIVFANRMFERTRKEIAEIKKRGRP